MPTPWLKKIRDTKQLTVFNTASTWGVAAAAAIKDFNDLALGVTLVLKTEDMDKANIVLKLAAGPTEHEWPGTRYYPPFKSKTKASFKHNELHGQCSTLSDPDRNEIIFAVIFLPGSIPNATDKQKQVVVLHEFIHAAGLDGGRGAGQPQDPGQDHDLVGVFAAQMKQDGDLLIEYMPMKGSKPMPPVRISKQTRCAVEKLWTCEEHCSLDKKKPPATGAGATAKKK